VTIILQFTFLEEFNQYPEDKKGDRNLNAYINSIYYIITTMTTVGYGDKSPKKVIPMTVSIMLEIGGIILYGYTMQQVNGAITELYLVNSNRIEDHEDLEAWLLLREKASQNPKERIVMDKIKELQTYTWKHDLEYFFSNEFFGEIAREIQGQLAEAYLNTLAKDFSLVFKNFDYNTLQNLIPLIRPRLYLKDEILSEKDDYSNGIHFIISGEVSIKHCRDQELSILSYGKGSFFGEEFILNQSSKRRVVVSSERLECMFLSSQDFWSSTYDAADSIINLRRMAVLRLTTIDIEEIEWDKVTIDILHKMTKLKGERKDIPSPYMSGSSKNEKRIKSFVEVGFSELFGTICEDKEMIGQGDALRLHTLKTLSNVQLEDPTLTLIRKEMFNLVPSSHTSIPPSPIKSTNEPKAEFFKTEHSPHKKVNLLFPEYKAKNSESSEILYDSPEEHLDTFKESLIRRYFDLEICEFSGVNTEESDADELLRKTLITNIITASVKLSEEFVEDPHHEEDSNCDEKSDSTVIQVLT